MITEEQYKQAILQQENAEKIISNYIKQQNDDFKSRWERFDKHNEYFTDDDLVYSAYLRCNKCDAGLAYPKNCDPWHQWTCSNVLKGVGKDKGHDAFSFTFYEIKSENQPSVNGATTRPNKK